MSDFIDGLYLLLVIALVATPFALLLLIQAIAKA